MKLKQHPENIIDAQFLHYLPTRMDITVTESHSRERINMSFHLDQLDFHYRRYLSLTDKTLHRVFWELRRPHEQMKYPINFSIKTWALVQSEIFNDIEKILMHNEMYEIMARHKLAKEKITQLIKTFQ